MSNDREKLKALLLSEEIAQIKALQKLLEDKQTLSEHLSEVLDPATDIAIAKNPNFHKKFSKIDSKSYVRAIKANRQTFIDALLPIIGPMIRKSVSSSIRRFVADVNRTVEMNVSFKALKWRWESLRTGIPIAEIVFRNTVEYQVEQIFLIDNHTGLLIAHAGHEDTLMQDKDAMSAMLTAIQDFVKDSVNASGDGLSSAEIDDDILWITHGNKAKIAAIIKGAPTQRLREVMMTASEGIHIEFHHELSSEDLWGNCPELETELEKLLLTKSQSDDEKPSKSINFWPWIIILSGLLFWWGWNSYQHHQNKSTINQLLNNTPGFILTNLSYDDGKFIASGLQDPLTTIDQNPENLQIISTPYLSLDTPIITKRIKHILNNDALEVTVIDGSVTLAGSIINEETFLNKLLIIQAQPGINQVINNVNVESVQTLDSYLKNNPLPETLQLSQTDGNLLLTGFTQAQNYERIKTELMQLGELDSERVVIIDPDEVKAFIRQNPVKFVSTISLNVVQKKQLNVISNKFLQLVAIENNGTINLLSQSDCQGSINESNENSQLRLNLVQDYLMAQGIPETSIVTKVMICDSQTENVNHSKIGVWLEVIK